jgi:hypothetical protein
LAAVIVKGLPPLAATGTSSGQANFGYFDNLILFPLGQGSENPKRSTSSEGVVVSMEAP